MLKKQRRLIKVYFDFCFSLNNALNEVKTQPQAHELLEKLGDN